MVDQLFADPDLANMYDAQCKGRPDFQFYLPRVMSAKAVLDIGCGTGELLRLARRAGHEGTLCGADPAEAMLDIARSEHDVEWISGGLDSVGQNREFDLVVMTGHAFQVLLGDEEIRAFLLKVRALLASDGQFVFETRNPLVREWEHWNLRTPVEFEGPDGAPVLYWRSVEMPVRGDLVSFTQTYARSSWDAPKDSASTLRFLDIAAMRRLLHDADLSIVDQFGDWDESPFADTSPEIISAARRR